MEERVMVDIWGQLFGGRVGKGSPFGLSLKSAKRDWEVRREIFSLREKQGPARKCQACVR